MTLYDNSTCSICGKYIYSSGVCSDLECWNNRNNPGFIPPTLNNDWIIQNLIQRVEFLEKIVSELSEKNKRKPRVKKPKPIILKG